MKLDRTIDIKLRMRTKMIDWYSQVTIYKMTSHDANLAFIKLRKSAPKGTPQWVLHYLDGMRDVYSQILYRDHLEFCYRINGKLYSVHRESERYYEKFGFLPSDLCNDFLFSGHYYKDTDKLFFGDTMNTEVK